MSLLNHRLVGLLIVIIGGLIAPITFAQQYDPSLYSGLRWRMIGPFRAGRTNAVSGVVGISDVLGAIRNAKPGSVEEGSVGAGTGTVAFGFKGGIGTASRRLSASLGGYTVGVLVQTNFGGILQIDGIPVGKRLGQYYLKEQLEETSVDGSIMIVLATDAPLSDRNLKRLAKRGLAGLARSRYISFQETSILNRPVRCCLISWK